MRRWPIGAGLLVMAVVGTAGWAASPEGVAVKVKEVVSLEARPFAVGDCRRTRLGSLTVEL